MTKRLPKLGLAHWSTCTVESDIQPRPVRGRHGSMHSFVTRLTSPLETLLIYNASWHPADGSDKDTQAMTAARVPDPLIATCRDGMLVSASAAGSISVSAQPNGVDKGGEPTKEAQAARQRIPAVKIGRNKVQGYVTG